MAGYRFFSSHSLAHSLNSLTQPDTAQKQDTKAHPKANANKNKKKEEGEGGSSHQHRRSGGVVGGAYAMAGMPLETMEGFVAIAPIVTNDFYVRILNGEGVYRLPRFNLTHQHLEVGR